jgi:ligand-binding sensor domain-containing protein/signal transduction histidine kinase
MRITSSLPYRAVLICFLGALLLLSSSAGLARRKSIVQYVHQNWTTANGLPQNSATSILQTHDGYIWLATQEGLARFDGMEFRVFDRVNTKELPISWMVRLKEDSSGALWMRPAGYAPGMVRVRNGKFTRIDTSNGLPHNRAITWETDRRGTMWIGTPGGLFEAVGDAFRTYTMKDGLPADTVIGLYLDSKENLWISTLGGLARRSGGRIERMSGQQEFADTLFLRMNGPANAFEDRSGTLWLNTRTQLLAYRNGTVTRYDKRTVLTDPTIQAVHEDAQGTVWFGTAGGLTSFAQGRFTPYTISHNADENNIFVIKEDREGSLWLATGKGIARFADGAFERFDHANGLSDNAVQDLMIDREGSIWVGTNGGGVDRFRDEKFVTYSPKVGLSYELVTAVTEDHTGAVWIGTAFGGLNRLKDGVITVFDNKQGTPFQEVRALKEDRDGTLWIGARGGLYAIRHDVLTMRSQIVDGQVEPLPGAFQLTRAGEWLMSSRNTLRSYRNGTFTTLATVGHAGVAADFIGQIFEDRTGRLWLATENGLYRYKDGKVEPVGPAQGFTGGSVNAFYEDQEGVLWIGASDNGLFRFKEETFTNITPKQGLFDYIAFTVFEDQAGYLWVSCNRGVYRVRKQELNDVANGKATSVTCTAYGTADGMESRECNGGYAPSGYQLHDGRLCFSTTRGLAMVNPADIRINTVPPPVVIDQFLVEGEQQPSATTIHVPAGRSRFEFHYAGISFQGANDVRYKYQLVGFDEGWIDAGSRREAYYTRLNPGEYTFRVIAANSDGIWNDQGATVSFVLEPHFYQTAWFIALAVLAFLTIGPSFYFYRMRIMKKRKAELEQLVRERTRELEKTLANLKGMQNQLILSEKMASLGQLTAGIAHEIKNPLNFITNFSVLSSDLTKDLRKELAAERGRVDPQRAAEIEGLLNDLEQNVTKINEHGKRADSIVRGMLLHSRGKSGERQETDLNALLAEYTNLAYHGMRAQDQSFNVKIETSFDPAVGKVSVVPQDLSRAILNIVNNACYAANDKKKTSKNGFMPVVQVSAKSLPAGIEIRIRDNGNGIPRPVLDKIFNPFFTTKPAGVGTGLGLSLSYDIITQVHRGEIRVDTQEGEFTEFVILIPRQPVPEKGVAA